ncbi:MAG: Hypothetical protein BHV28_02870 [Candidatus Tokpelaia hoelldobleri]|uniref:Bacteriophage T5 Orf172 DNA-binding domain-containing protein n=1 Tax=Candidatus Tokpelaia hoelldobleri TaxID=1902579 RepID=A0A1U9JT17_9HYPH|nr:MAG: Hypothetical protein BHV28_02870 [Candidatus Tokpelaia hoelldoblerii]
MSEPSDLELLAALGITPQQKKKQVYSAVEERVIAGFEDIVRFFDSHKRVPLHGEDRDIFERLYAVRLDRLRASSQWKTLLRDFDPYHLLDGAENTTPIAHDLDDAALLAILGVSITPDENSLEHLHHVKPRAEIRQSAEEIASRIPCADFARFSPLFERACLDLADGLRKIRRFGKNAEIKRGEFFILNGQMVYVADVGNFFKGSNGGLDARLRVIYDNSTESDILLRSLQRALYKDEAGRRITELSAGPLFGEEPEADDLASGTIYVLRSDHPFPFIVEHRDTIHKIGVTGGDIKKRIANAEFDPTYLMAKVEIVASYQLFNIHRTKLEGLLHKIFAHAQFDIVIPDRFGRSIHPKEWFLVPLAVIDDVVDKIRDGTLPLYEYEPATGQLQTIHEQ